MPFLRTPARGEIWFVQLHTDPPEKGRRPVVVISLDARNRNPHASTVLVVPLSTTPARAPSHVELPPGETGLSELSTARAEDISCVPKAWLVEPRSALRRLGENRLREIAAGVQLALGFPSVGY
ncbi:MAG TPA: type II toxin-antitoxin system PemK/MazF family toxin [Terriglobales bacterium]|nr:type II toxin-antitoxin system PemK/MazF family toxin [Terriglobales bacterium]